jgi:hypothetical protein
MPYTPRCFPKNRFSNIDFSELQKMKNAWDAFERIYAIQVLAREDALVDGKYDVYVPYQYISFEERMLARLGQQLHIEVYPPSTLDSTSTETETWNLA